MKDLKLVFKKSSTDTTKIVFVSPKSPCKDKMAIKLGYESKGEFYSQSSDTLYIGAKNIDIDTLRESSAKAIRYLRDHKFSTASLELSPKSELAYAQIIGLMLGYYQNDQYKTEKKNGNIKEIVLTSTKLTQSEVLYLINIASIISSSINLTRDLVNMAPQDATSKYIESVAKNVAKEAKLNIKVLGTKEIEKENMNCLLAVNRASANPPRVIHLSYKPKKSTKKIVLVGKGLTYDCGGLSLKPSDYMVSMKADKSGACAVLAIMRSVALLGLDVEVHGIMGMAENMIGGNAFRPDDVLISREGKSIEVRNTDAEGRLVLVDCLSYAQDLKPDILMDFATLTGACVVGLGEYTSGIMGYNTSLQSSYLQNALKSGELMAILPFNRHIEKLLESKIADISNISSSRYGGAISAGMFLGEFIRDEYKDRWLHIDIAGPAYVDKEWDVNANGGSGAGVRATIEFIKNL